MKVRVRDLLVMLAFLFPFISSQAQGHIPKTRENSFKGALSFLPEGSYGITTLYSPFTERRDPLASHKEWIEDDKGQAVRGLMAEAVLFMEWWTLLGDPIESYLFKWKSTGYYEVRYRDNGELVTKTISRSQLAKYPDLQRWFDNIAPLNINFRIDFTAGRLDEQAYRDFRQRKSQFETLGAAGFKMNYSRKVDGVQMLFERSEQTPGFNLPVMANGWRDFMSVPADVPNDKLTDLVALFRMAETVNINSFQITSIRWPIDGLVALARRYDEYENGKKELSPDELVASATPDALKTMGDDFWNATDIPQGEMEIYKDPRTSKMGLKTKNNRNVIPATFVDIREDKDEKVFFCRSGYGADEPLIAINKFGKEVGRLNNATWREDKKVFLETTEEEEGECSLIFSYNALRFTGGRFVQVAKLYDFVNYRSKAVITLRSSNESYEQRRQAEEREKQRAEERSRVCTQWYADVRARMSSRGYIYLSNFER